MTFEEVRRRIWRELDEALKRGAPVWEVELCANACRALREIRSKTDAARRELYGTEAVVDRPVDASTVIRIGAEVFEARAGLHCAAKSLEKISSAINSTRGIAGDRGGFPFPKVR